MTTSPVTATHQPVTKQPPKSASTVLAETEAQWLFTETELANTPSITDGMPLPTERETRTKGLSFILQVGLMLKIQQPTLNTAGVFLNRFLMRHSLHKCPANPKPLHHYQVAAVSLLLATKTDETIRRQKDIIIACCRVAQKNPALVIDEQNKDYWRWRDTLLHNEDILLETLCFDLTVESPFRIFYDMVRKLGVEANQRLRKAAWAFLCDSLMTTLCLVHSSRTIAGAAFFAGARFAGFVVEGDEGAKTPNTVGEERLGMGEEKLHLPPLTNTTNNDEKTPPWYDRLNLRLRDVKKACNFMASLYELSREEREAREVGAEASEGGTPYSTARRGSQQGGGRTPAGGGRTPAGHQTPSTQDKTAGAGGYESQNYRVYEGLRVELEESEGEDGEVEDDDDDDDDDGEIGETGEGGKIDGKRSAAWGNGVNGHGDRDRERRGVKRGREVGDVG